MVVMVQKRGGHVGDQACNGSWKAQYNGVFWESLKILEDLGGHLIFRDTTRQVTGWRLLLIFSVGCIGDEDRKIVQLIEFGEVKTDRLCLCYHCVSSVHLVVIQLQVSPCWSYRDFTLCLDDAFKDTNKAFPLQLAISHQLCRWSVVSNLSDMTAIHWGCEKLDVKSKIKYELKPLSYLTY